MKIELPVIDGLDESIKADILPLIDETLLLLKAISRDELPEELKDLPHDLLEELLHAGLLETLPLETSLARIVTSYYERQMKKTVAEIVDRFFHDFVTVPLDMIPYEEEKLLRFKPIQNAIEKIATQLEVDLGPDSPFAHWLADKVEFYVGQAYTIGRQRTLRRDIVSLTDPLDRNAIRFLRKHEVFWITQGQEIVTVHPRISEVVRNAFAQGITNKDEIARLLKEGLETEFIAKRRSYWRLLASATINRARNFGALQSLVEAEQEEFVIYAKLDARTCAFCRDMHGRVFSVKRAARRMNLLYHAQSPEEVKRLVPWVKRSEWNNYIGKDSATIQRRFPMPPFHGFCRCAIVS
ncbi:hypothetical protein J7M23_08185, partial [Candidatus Sumerlaeota bacterium]|nr:hypothetical protein [Candidatus Sumerlaeota bacterium]